MHAHPMVPNTERVGTHTGKITADGIFDGFYGGEYPNQRHDANGNDQYREYGTQKMCAYGNQRYPDVFYDQ